MYQLPAVRSAGYSSSPTQGPCIFAAMLDRNLILESEGITCMNSVGKTKFHDDYSVMKWKLIANIIYCQMISRKLERKIICLDYCCS